MTRLPVLSACALVGLFLSMVPLAAQPLSLYPDEEQARLHCSGDTVVWLDFQTRRYYVAGQARYGRGSNAVFSCRNEARRSGYRRSIFGRR